MRCRRHLQVHRITEQFPVRPPSRKSWGFFFAPVLLDYLPRQPRWGFCQHGTAQPEARNQRRSGGERAKKRSNAEEKRVFRQKVEQSNMIFRKSSFFQVFSATPGLKPVSSGVFSGFFGIWVLVWVLVESPEGFSFRSGLSSIRLGLSVACGLRRAGTGVRVRGQQKTHPFRSGF